MKRYIMALVAVIIVIISVGTVSFANDNENLIINSGFETELLGAGDWKFTNRGNWYNEGGAERTEDEKHSGEYAVKLSEATVGQRVLLNAGKAYRLTLSLKSDKATNSITIGFYNGTAAWPASNAIKTFDIETSTQWQEVSLEFECTNTQDYIIGLLVWGASGNVYFDDVTLCEFEMEYDGGGIINGNFADGTDSWIMTGSANTEVKDGVLVISGTDYETRISQKVQNIENGTYDLTAYVSNTDILGISYIYAKTEGHTMASTSIPISENLQRIVVPGIIVNGGKCDVGVYINGSSTISLDNLTLVKSEETRVQFLKGGEISKLTYVEDRGGKFYRADGSEGDALQIMAENGFNLARIRVLNNPGKGHSDGEYYLPSGYQNEEDCLEMARRARAKGMKILFSFAYSDTWSDGANQIIPYDWQEYINANKLSGEALYEYLETQVYEYTKDIMQKLIAQGTCPEFVSIGNEMQAGLFYGNYKSGSSLYNNPNMLARFVNAGSKAVRETSPKTKIVLHTDHAGEIISRRQNFVKAFEQIDFDVIGASYYPFYTPTITIDTVVNEFATLINKYDKDVIIMETGYNWTPDKPDGYKGQLTDSGYYTDIYGESQNGQRAFLTELYSKLKQAVGGRCIGDLYWDPVMIYDGGVEHTKDTGIGWAIDEENDITQGNVVPNSTIFDFSGKVVEGQKAMKYNTNSDDNINITGKIQTVSNSSNTEITISVNGEEYKTYADKFGEYIVSVPYPANGKLAISAQGYTHKYNVYAPSDGIFVDNINFLDGEISEIEGDFDKNGNLSFEVNYRTANPNAVLYVAMYKDDVLIGCKNVESGMFEAVSDDGSYTLKAFLWDKMYPLSAEKQKTITYSK